jgi:S-methylmethionine-dependent homocysteine/selenocysteine methylase
MREAPGWRNMDSMTGLPLLLDGPVGTELARRGVRTPLPLWSALALDEAPDVLAAIHSDYAAAGARVHTANTFRTSRWSLARAGRAEDARRLTEAAVRIARDAVPPDHRVAGCIAPLDDCYSPELSPPPAVAAKAHAHTAGLLADAGVDVILCETFPHVGEARIAARAALETGRPVWLSLTPGPSGALLSDEAIVRCALAAAELGVERVLVNCGRPPRLRRAVRALAQAGLSTGAYGNVGEPCAESGWRSEGESAPEPYAAAALEWIAAGARLVGGCCGTTPAHIAALAAALARRGPV